jgi:pentatricopeptide repeat protein
MCVTERRVHIHDIHALPHLHLTLILQADAAVYNTLINACAGVGDLEKALETVQAMQVTN